MRKRNYWKSLFIKYFDFNSNKKVDLWEVILTIILIIIFQLTIEITGNYLYSWMTHNEKDKPNTTLTKQP